MQFKIWFLIKLSDAKNLRIIKLIITRKSSVMAIENTSVTKGLIFKRVREYVLHELSLEAIGV